MTPEMPTPRSTLVDMRAHLSLCLVKTNPQTRLHYPYNFVSYIRALDPNWDGVKREDLEELVTKIQVTKLLGQIDPEFSYPMSLMGFAKSRPVLDLWETAFQDFLKNSLSPTFDLQ
jgi:hypothetical protein